MKEIKKVSYERLHLHITRRCNLSCKHCYCGKAQNIDMSKEVMDRLAETTSYINKLYLFGGELSLCTNTLEYLLEALKKNNVAVYGVRFSTNAAEKSERLCAIINRFAEYVTIKDCDCEPCKIFISTDRIHKDIVPDLDENIAFYQERCNYFYRFVDGADEAITYEGNARENYNFDDLNLEEFRLEFKEIECTNNHISHDGLTMNVFGDIFTFSTSSYERNDSGKYEIANILKDDLMTKVNQYNNRQEVRVLDPVYKAFNEFVDSYGAEYPVKDKILTCYDKALMQMNKAKEISAVFVNLDAKKEFKRLLNLITDRDNIEYMCSAIDNAVDAAKLEVKTKFPYLNDEFRKQTDKLLESYITDKGKFFYQMITGGTDEERHEVERLIDQKLEKIYSDCATQNHENQFEDHETTQKKYPQFTPKDCIMWDNSMKHLADKKGIAWKDKIIRQRHIDVIEKMKKEKLSPWEARSVRIS